MQKKLKNAISVITRCRGDKGFYASSERYKYEYWTRDLCYCVNSLISLGFAKDVKNQLLTIWKKQAMNGEVPRYMIDKRFKWLPGKLFTKIRNGKILSTIKSLDTMETRFNKWTIDSTPLTVIATYKYAAASGDSHIIEALKPQIEKALRYTKLHVRDFLIRGGDWRDSMPWLRNKFLLSNNVMLYELYKILGEGGKATIIKDRINSEFWNGEYYTDFIGSVNFDCFGASSAVLSGIVPRGHFKKLSEKILSASSKYGIKNMVEVKPVNREENGANESCNQRYAIWPLVNTYAIMAIRKMGANAAAEKELKKMENLLGFREWYNPDTGDGHGSREQLWSAVAYYELIKVLRYSNLLYTYR